MPAYLDPFPILTFPITEAEGATKHSAETVGPIPSTATKRVEGTSFSVYLVISIPFPAPSSADLRDNENIASIVREAEADSKHHSDGKPHTADQEGRTTSTNGRRTLLFALHSLAPAKLLLHKSSSFYLFLNEEEQGEKRERLAATNLTRAINAACGPRPTLGALGFLPVGVQRTIPRTGTWTVQLRVESLRVVCCVEISLRSVCGRTHPRKTNIQHRSTT